MEAILKFSMRAGRPHVLVRWTGLDASGDTWEPLENLTNCEDAIRAFEQARRLVLPRAPPPPPSHACGGVAPPLPPAGYSVDPNPGVLGATLVGRRILYWWLSDGWQLGTVSAHLPPPALRTWWPTPGKPQRYAARWTRCWTLLLTGSAGCCFHHWRLLELREFPGGTTSWPRRTDLGIEFSLCSVTGSTRP